jgi:hypothetical protein
MNGRVELPNHAPSSRLRTLGVIASLALTATVWMRPAAAQDERDFVFTDDEGHLVLRFAGAGPSGLDAEQREEIVNVQLSTMVHDRLRADAQFEAEPVDATWAGPTTAELAQRVETLEPEFSLTALECRSESCRLELDHPGGRRVAEHQSLMATVQRTIRALIDSDPASFEPVFMIAGHYQEPANPYLKVFVRRADNRQDRPSHQSSHDPGAAPASR